MLRKARERGIKVLTWDADAEPDARDFFVNQATPEGIGNTLTDEAARLLGGKGEFAIITGALSAANQNEWIAFIKKRVAEKYPGLKLADDPPERRRPRQGVRRDADDHARASEREADHGHLGAGRARRGRSGAPGGRARTSTSSACRCRTSTSRTCTTAYVQTVVLWNTRDLGYLTVHAGVQLAARRRCRPARRR